MDVKVPKVFISYSHDDQEHKLWVLQLAHRLRNSGVDAILDQFRLGLGSDLSSFMEHSIDESDRIIMVCTDNYVKKADSGKGGVGYEKMIITSEYMRKIDSTKVIPLIKQNGSHDVPMFLKTKLFVDFSKTDEYEVAFDELLREIHGVPLFSEPPVGNNPFESVVEKPVRSNVDKKMLLLEGLINAYDSGEHYFHLDAIQEAMQSSRIFTEIYIKELMNGGYIESVRGMHGETYYVLTDKAKIYAINQKWIRE
ncbi:toll/interleukin-1 receptor domain-containing protein [Vibrio vulnificus]|uniref:toll/interleukin-1 receptor domain-containing protein n=1 Tax=Vibrio vulnificus TaxID=672 RepID=UPI001A340A8E|nr:toll/interleukin-1 receptor domain-containing protein [Vibrio vulnificus]MCA0779444.1 toll/interleukin-1 receptor domain-containing protein [Vibrio vulnificus]HAS6231978.1 TIR domain-containing protein [Vibrio vulnificus]